MSLGYFNAHAPLSKVVQCVRMLLMELQRVHTYRMKSRTTHTNGAHCVTEDNTSTQKSRGQHPHTAHLEATPERHGKSKVKNTVPKWQQPPSPHKVGTIDSTDSQSTLREPLHNDAQEHLPLKKAAVHTCRRYGKRCSANSAHNTTSNATAITHR